MGWALMIGSYSLRWHPYAHLFVICFDYNRRNEIEEKKSLLESGALGNGTKITDKWFGLGERNVVDADDGFEHGISRFPIYFPCCV